jgi:hypothetical protein
MVARHHAFNRVVVELERVAQIRKRTARHLTAR